MNNIAYTQFNAYVRQTVKDPQNIIRAVSIALGISLSRKLPVTQGDLDQTLGAFDTQHIFTVRARAGVFNEEMNIDFDVVEQIARGFWRMRQQAVCPCDRIIMPKGTGGMVDKVFGAVLYLTPEYIDYMNKHAEVLITLINRIDALTSQE
jgi:hypothetical protein